VLNFLESGGIRESYFFNRLEAPVNAQILKFWLLPHCPHQLDPDTNLCIGIFISVRFTKRALYTQEIKILQKHCFCAGYICRSGLDRDVRSNSRFLCGANGNKNTAKVTFLCGIYLQEWS